MAIAYADSLERSSSASAEPFLDTSLDSSMARILVKTFSSRSFLRKWKGDLTDLP